jgi:hypothetical protein
VVNEIREDRGISLGPGFQYVEYYKYIHTRSAWSKAAYKKKYAAELELWNKTKSLEVAEVAQEKVEL